MAGALDQNPIDSIYNRKHCQHPREFNLNSPTPATLLASSEYSTLAACKLAKFCFSPAMTAIPSFDTSIVLFRTCSCCCSLLISLQSNYCFLSTALWAKKYGNARRCRRVVLLAGIRKYISVTADLYTNLGAENSRRRANKSIFQLCIRYFDGHSGGSGIALWLPW